MRKVSGRRLFQSDGYTFVRWLDEEEVEMMLASGEIRKCIDPRTDRAIGFRLNAKLSERITSLASLLPGRTYDPMMQPPSLNYEIPHAGDCRRVGLRRFSLRRITVAKNKEILVRRTIRVSARKIDFTAAPYNQTQPPHSGVATASNVSSSLNSAMRTA